MLVNELKDDLFAYLGTKDRRRCERREGELLDSYDLTGLRTCSSRIDYRENLYLVDALESLLTDQVEIPARDLRVVDVGSKNWNYVFGLERFWRHVDQGEGRRVEMLGFEIDGHGVYRNLRSRCDYARAYVAQTGNSRVDYRVDDFMACDQTAVDAVTMFYPFMTRYALLQWGLPLSCFGPGDLLRRALTVLRPGGVLVVFNQTATERDILHGLLTRLGADIVCAEPLRSKLVHYHHRAVDRWATVACTQHEGAQGATPTVSLRV